jgi:peptidoglycan/LPS O-acetylase OafA/YrhL
MGFDTIPVTSQNCGHRYSKVHMVENNAPSRITGLDTLRAAAILLVLMSHYDGFVSGASTFGVVGDAGRAGVDLFFVLSGYLIGNGLLASLRRTGEVPLKSFFARRFLRTLPNYYVAVALYLAFPAALGGSNALDTWRFATFTQNFGMRYGQVFTHSWSLCIEEQFYVLLPLALLLFAGTTRSVRLAWTVAGGVIAAGMAARAYAFMKYGHDAFSAEVYYATWARGDELVPGVAIAMLKNFHPQRYENLLRRGNSLLAAGLAATVGILYCFRVYSPNAAIVTTFGFSLLAIAFAVLTLAALSPGSLLNRIRIPGATRLALWSYAVYLMHKPVFMVLRPHLERLHIDPNAPLTILTVFALGIGAGWVLYACVERPCMRLRSRWFPQAPLACAPQ